MLEFAAWLRTMLQSHQPDELVVEKPYAGPMRNTFGVLMMYVAVVLLVHFEYRSAELPRINFMLPHLVKKSFRLPKGSSHEARKRTMVETINARYGLSLVFKPGDKTKRISEDDTADAIALGDAWLRRFRPDSVPGV